jgi:hypothetical protein
MNKIIIKYFTLAVVCIAILYMASCKAPIHNKPAQVASNSIDCFDTNRTKFFGKEITIDSIHFNKVYCDMNELIVKPSNSQKKKIESTVERFIVWYNKGKEKKRDFDFIYTDYPRKTQIVMYKNKSKDDCFWLFSFDDNFIFYQWKKTACAYCNCESCGAFQLQFNLAMDTIIFANVSRELPIRGGKIE